MCPSPTPPFHVHAPRFRCRGAVALAALALLAPVAAWAAHPDGVHAADAPAAKADASLRVGAARGGSGRRIPSHFVGLSVEWSLVERYMAPNARRGFANLLRNLGTGVLRLGGGSQDLMPFEPDARNTNRVITPDDLSAVRATVRAADTARAAATGAPSWGLILGTAMAPRNAARPWIGRDHTRAFVRRGLQRTFRGSGERYVAGIELGNEPDVSYRANARRYVHDLVSYSDPRVKGHFNLVGPNTSATIVRWGGTRSRRDARRSFWSRPRRMLQTIDAAHTDHGPFAAFAASHFYPMARQCSFDAYRCATRRRLLSDERMQNFDAAVYAHARDAARVGLAYRVEEMNSASGRGVHGVSDVAASAVWALDAMFHAACPQSPAAPSANAACSTGAVGVNFHNAEAREFFGAAHGNAYYNPVRFDPTAAGGAPTAAPEYYALLLFAHFAQATSGLRPVTLTPRRPGTTDVRGWLVEAGGSEQRLFLLNKGHHRENVSVTTPSSMFALDRMTPYDPTGSNRTADAPMTRIDGRAVSADGSWAGFQPARGRIVSGRIAVALEPCEAAVVTLSASGERGTAIH